MESFERRSEGGLPDRAVHIYQRSISGFLLFYSLSDYLVFLSIVSKAARRYNIRIIAICPMIDHIHLLVAAPSRKSVSSFVRDYTSVYAKEFGRSTGVKGRVFERSFGCAVKKGYKAIRTCCSYVNNNPCEKKLCERAEQYRWTFLAYAAARNPFSEPIRLRFASRPLRRALKLVGSMYVEGSILRHSMLDKILSSLDEGEMEQFADYVISLYNVIDYSTLLSLYGSYDRACLAFASNQGSEYDIQEEYDPFSHVAFIKITEALKEKFGISSIKDLLSLSIRDRLDLMRVVTLMTHATWRQAEKYFRIERGT
jgi:REP element-mobilizing transposase RayT